MPILKPRYNPRLNPYGEPEDVTPAGMETEFINSKGGDPANFPLTYKFKVQANQVWAYFGEVINPRKLYFYYSKDYAETFTRVETSWANDLKMQETWIESTFLSNKLWLHVPMLNITSLVSLETYSSEDNGATWDFEWSVSQPFVNIIEHRIFVSSSGVYQVAKMVGNNLRVWKNGVFLKEFPLPGGSGLFAIMSSFYDNKYESGFVTNNYSSTWGGQNVFEFTGKDVVQRTNLPIDMSGATTRNLLQDLFWDAKENFLMVSTQTVPTVGGRLYYSFDRGVKWNEIVGAFFIKQHKFTHLGKQSLIRRVNTTPDVTHRSEGFLTDLNLDTANWQPIIDAYNSDYDIGFSTRANRRASRIILWKLPPVS